MALNPRRPARPGWSCRRVRNLPTSSCSPKPGPVLLRRDGSAPLHGEPGSGQADPPRQYPALTHLPATTKSPGHKSQPSGRQSKGHRKEVSQVYSYLASQAAKDRQREMLAQASQQRLGRQACALARASLRAERGPATGALGGAQGSAAARRTRAMTPLPAGHASPMSGQTRPIPAAARHHASAPRRPITAAGRLAAQNGRGRLVNSRRRRPS